MHASRGGRGEGKGNGGDGEEKLCP